MADRVVHRLRQDRQEPETPWSVAIIVTLAAATPVTTPAVETVAYAVLDVDHVAAEVTFCVLPSDIIAVAVNSTCRPPSAPTLSR